MGKKMLFCFLLCLAAGYSFAETVSAVIEINGVTVNGGLVYVAVYNNEKDFKKEARYTGFMLAADNTALTCTAELPEGDYVVSAFQDVNGNQELDTKAFGIPAEPLGLTNYNLKGAPGGFQKLKVPVNRSSTRITVNMGKITLF